MRGNRRIYFLFISISALSIILIFRLFYIQLIKGPVYSQEAFYQKLGKTNETIRGEICDRNGKSLTGTYYTDYAVISPRWLTTTERHLLVENKVLDSLEDNKITNIRISPDNLKILNKLKGRTPGILFYEKSIRYGPAALATHVVGFHGQTGIEKSYDDLLEGDRGVSYIVKDGFEQPIAGLALTNNESDSWGIKLTIDKDIQKIVEEIMDKKIKAGAVVVVDARNWEVLAMASRPNYKQYKLKEYLGCEDAPLINRSIESYTPGSIFKIVILSAVLEEKVADLNDVFYCSGFEQVGGNIFKCSSFESGGHKEITLKNALAYSCNSVFIQLGIRLGEERVLKYAKLFGLGKKTHIGLPEEKSGDLPDRKDVFYQDLGNLSIGQGPIGITPIQANQIFLTVVNGGILKSPILIKEVMDQNGNKVPVELAKPGKRILSVKTAKKVMESLEAATQYGTGQRANPQNNIGIGGKTGTAEIDGNTSHAWFVGYYPSDLPEFVISVFIESGGSGSAKAVPVFREIVEEILTLKKR